MTYRWWHRSVCQVSEELSFSRRKLSSSLIPTYIGPSNGVDDLFTYIMLCKINSMETDYSSLLFFESGPVNTANVLDFLRLKLNIKYISIHIIIWSLNWNYYYYYYYTYALLSHDYQHARYNNSVPALTVMWLCVKLLFFKIDDDGIWPSYYNMKYNNFIFLLLLLIIITTYEYI